MQVTALALVFVRLLKKRPVEHIWDDIREKHFDNHIFKSLDAVEDTLCKALQALDADPERLRSMTNFPHLRITA